MKSIIYSIYRNGDAGLSNLIMSIELGVVLSRLTDRVLVLKGNRSPPANVVNYDGLVCRYPSRVTDLIDLGVPWIDTNSTNPHMFVPHEICPRPVWDSIFYFPAYLSTQSDDIRSFAGRRSDFITVDDNLQNIPTLSFSGGLEANTLSFYSYFFYLDSGAQLQMLDALRQLQPKPELAAFAKRVADDLGPFNAVHIRRGDFKVTTGVTTLDRTPGEAVAALDDQFSGKDRLVILTDEAEDPFFDEIKGAYRDHVFLDHHILDNYGPDFMQLPAHDSIALAYISQLVGAELRDFIGTMTSTFTALIQRMRGNRGKDERFKFLWNELPAAGDKLEPGRHPFSDCIRLEKGVMVAEREGPYSWNGYDARLNPAWMREWPESFLNETVMAERALNRATVLSRGLASPAALERNNGRGGSLAICFLDTNVIASSNSENTTGAIKELFAAMIFPSSVPPLGEVRIDTRGNRAELSIDGDKVGEDRDASGLLRALYREVVCRFIDGYPELIWLHAGSAASGAGAAVLPGKWGRGKSSLVVALCERGWSFLSDDIAPLDAAKWTVAPFPATPRIRANSGKEIPRSKLGNIPKSAVPIAPEAMADGPQPISMIVFPYYSTRATTQLTPILPGQAVGELLENCLSLAKNENATINRLCAMVEALPVYRLRFSDAAEAAELLIDAQASMLLPIRTGYPGEEGKERNLDRTEAVASINVDVTLKGGLHYSSVLPVNSPILRDLYVALAFRQEPNPAQPAILMQLPIDGGRRACSFMSHSLVSVITRPPVLIQPQSAEGAHGQTARAIEAYPFVLIDEFLTPDENKNLLGYALANEAQYVQSKVATDVKDYRKSKVLFAIKDTVWRGIFMSRLKLHLPHITAALNMTNFLIGESEIQLTASNDGEYFKPHADAGNKGEPTASREITYVYYLHRMPKPYSGGELLFYSGQPGHPSFDSGSGVRPIAPQNNSLIAFASDRWHEVDMVRCPTGAFPDSRFTVNGWLRGKAP